jgi:hypothetical protein
VELKQGSFKPEYKGQMELYLRWLAKHETEAGEESPMGIILCAGKNTEQIELLELGSAGIHVAEYLTVLPPRLDDNYGYNIESSAHRGDPIEAMVSRVGQLDKFARCMDKIVALGATPKAILISGRGDDIAGTEFGMLINNIDLQPIPGWNDQIIAGVIDTRIAAAYRLMFLSINSLCQRSLSRTFPILVHGYDYPVPDGRGFLGGGWLLPGPWLKPGFDEKLFTDINATTQMMTTIIDRFNTMLQNLVREPGFQNVTYIDLRNTLSNSQATYKDWWANEIHPNAGGIFGGQDGWGAVAAKFQGVLATLS